MTGVTFLDEIGIVRDWANTVTDLTGMGNPVRDGFHLTTRESPGGGVYGVLFLNDAADDASGQLASVNISCSLWGPNLESAQRAANAYGNACLGIVAAPVTVDSHTIWCASDVRKMWSPDRGHARFVVTADFTISGDEQGN